MKFVDVFRHTDSFDNEDADLRRLAVRVAEILYPLYPSDPDDVDIHYMGEIDSRNQ